MKNEKKIELNSLYELVNRANNLFGGNRLYWFNRTKEEEITVTYNEFYHYDTPLTVKHESEALFEAGFSSVKVLKNWGATYTIKAVK